MSQPVPSATSTVAGCVIQLLDTEACERDLAWVLGEPRAVPPGDATGLVWVLAHCDDGVTWGRYDADAQSWHLGNQVAPEVSPMIRRDALHELRIFGEPGEVLIWRNEVGLRGRVLRETDPPADRSDSSDPLRPSDEPRILRGDRVHATRERGFSHLTDRTGAQQVIPIELSDPQLRAGSVRLHVRHYYRQDPASGVIRIGATRLVKLTREGTDGT